MTTVKINVSLRAVNRNPFVITTSRSEEIKRADGAALETDCNYTGDVDLFVMVIEERGYFDGFETGDPQHRTYQMTSSIHEEAATSQLGVGPPAAHILPILSDITDDTTNFSDFTTGYEMTGMEGFLMKEALVTNGEKQSLFLCEFHEGLRVGGSDGQRLLDHHVQAVIEGKSNLFIVLGVRCADKNRIETLLANHLLVIGVGWQRTSAEFYELRYLRRVRVGNRDELCAWIVYNLGYMPEAHVRSATDHADADLGASIGPFRIRFMGSLLRSSFHQRRLIWN